MKICKKCKIEKELNEFAKEKRNKSGLLGTCKYCIKEYKKEWGREYRKSNKERSKEYYKEYYESNKEKIIQRSKEHYKNNIEANKERSKEYYQANKERSKELGKEYYQANEEKIKKYLKEYYIKNKEHIISKSSANYNKNKKEILKKQRIYSKKYNKENRLKINKRKREFKRNNTLSRFKSNLRKRTWSAFKNKGYCKTSKTQEMLGVDWEVCKANIERQFTKGMSWENQGDWHIDHIIPLSSANTEQELKKLCHYSNLQPLWAVDNLMKSAKINGQQNKFRF